MENGNGAVGGGQLVPIPRWTCGVSRTSAAFLPHDERRPYKTGLLNGPRLVTWKLHSSTFQKNKFTEMIYTNDGLSSQSKPFLQQPRLIAEKARAALPARLNALDAKLCAAYMCSIIAITTPVVLLPSIAADHIPPSESTAAVAGSALVASLTALSSMGGAIGKFTNGFICQSIGGRNSATRYLAGLSFFSFLLSTSAKIHGLALIGMEFCSSIMWTAMTVIIAEEYANDQEKFTSAIMALSLSSTFGTVLTKIIGTTLLRYFHWHYVARAGAVVALLGALVMKNLRDAKQDSTEGSMRIRKMRTARTKCQSDPVRSISSSLYNVLGNRLFWQVGVSHAMVFLARSSDKVFGTFLRDVTGVPRYDWLSVSLTIGFVHGLFTSRQQPVSLNFLRKRYSKAVLSALALAICANQHVSSVFGGPVPLALAAAVASGAMASSVSFQFYQLPAACAKRYGENKAICLSLLDGLGFFVGVPVWVTIGRIVGCERIGRHGWTLAWSLLAGLFAFGGSLMLSAAPSILETNDKKG